MHPASFSSNRSHLTLAAVLIPAVSGPARGQVGDLEEAVAQYVKVDAPVVALTGVQVVDGTGASPMANATIVIRDGVIEAVGEGVEVPEGAEVLDLPSPTPIRVHDLDRDRPARGLHRPHIGHSDRLDDLKPSPISAQHPRHHT